MSEPSPKGEQALALVNLGYRVIPLIPNDKKPLTKHGCKDASEDLGQVAEWWCKWPDANIGIATGSGLVVIDVDRVPNSDGVKKALPNPWLEPLSECLESLAADSVVESPTGGFHLYFKSDRGAFKNSAGVIAEGVDVRADGGYIVAPGSVIDGKYYRELENLPLVARSQLPQLPPRLFEALLKGSKAPSKASGTTLGKINEGQRHDFLASEAGRLAGCGISEAALLAALREINKEKCNPPQDDEDLQHLARDFAKKDDREPWALKTRRVSEIEEKETEWLIGERIPRGMISTIVGLPGSGKSMLAAFIASKISRGLGLNCPPEIWSPRAPGRVLIFAFEDSAETTLRPRLEAMGADLERIEVCEVKAQGKEERGIDLLKDFHLIEQKAIEFAPDLIVIDPVNSAWGAGKDQNDDVDSRQVLGPFKRLAEEQGLSVLLVTHTNKRSDVADAQDSASGARALVGLSRAVYLLGTLKEEDGSFLHYLTDMKVNIRGPLHALKFKIEGEKARAAITVIGTEEMNANEFMREKAKRALADRKAKGESKLEEAKRSAIEVLKENRGAMHSTALETALTDKGHAKKTVQEAMKTLEGEGALCRSKERKKNGVTWVYFKDNEPLELREVREVRQDF
jgi:RecA-family ATPase